MKKYKRREEDDSLSLIYEDYKFKRINTSELWERLKNIPDTRQYLKEMSFVKDIVSELKAHPNLHEIHNGTWFSKLVENCRTVYLQHLTLIGKSIDDYTFTNYVQQMINQYPVPKKEYGYVKNKNMFWELVNEMQKYMNGEK